MTAIPIILLLVGYQGVEVQNSPELQAMMAMGARVAQVQRRLPVLHQVVLVPDEATYLDELSKWSPQARWPVLFDKEPFASRFIRSFQPEKVWRRSAVDKEIDDIGISMQRTVAQAWGGVASTEVALHNVQLPPLGVVLTSTKDPARTAAVALAAGRGQLLKYIAGDWGKPNAILDATRTSAILQEVDNILSSSGAHYASIGDTIDAITLCLSLPSRVNYHAARENPVAITDVIGRDASGKRFAWAGWVFGSKPQSAYIAMCSLFLQRDQYWFCNTYPNKGDWARYGLGNIPQILPKYGIDAVAIEGTFSSLIEADKGGVATDVIYFTSKGNQDFLQMAAQRVSPSWLPILDTPCALYFLHSWSLKNPMGKATVGGVWLSRGVYAYVGSSHEPMLSAFVPPTEMLRRTMSLIPLLPASRFVEGESNFATAWRLNTIGDPLMLCPPKSAVQRIVLPAESSPQYEDLAVLSQTAMQRAIDEPSDTSFEEAINCVALLGRDEIAAGLFIASVERSVAGSRSARAAISSIFRIEDGSLFAHAFSLLEATTKPERDMLWHLLGSEPNTDLQALLSNLRRPYSSDDLSLITDRVIATKGRAALLSIIDTELQHAQGRNQRELTRMRKQYGQ